MSKMVERCLERAQKTEWFIERGVLEIRDAVLFFNNFSGQKNKFGSTAKNFNIVLPDSLKEYLENYQIQNKETQVHIHRFPREVVEDEPFLYYINVKVNMTSDYPPAVTLFVNLQTTNPQTGNLENKKSKVSLQDATIGCLDGVDMDRADVKLNLRESKANPGHAVFYLKQLNVIQTKTPDFGGIYDDWDAPVEESMPVSPVDSED